MPVVDRLQPYSDTDGNTIQGSPRHKDVQVHFAAKNCQLIISDTANIQSSAFRFNADNSIIEIGDASQFVGMIEVGLRSSVRVGTNLTVTRYCYICAAEGSTVEIGDDCMFASGNEIRGDDAHPIFDLASGERVNKSRPIKIGNHVWIAARAIVLSGSDIGNGAVIGHSSVVKGSIPENCVAAGYPARVVRSGITWDRTHVSKRPPFVFDHISAIQNRS